MENPAQNDPKLYSIAEVAQLIHVSQHTIRNWEREGVIKASFRTGSGHRRFTEAEVKAIKKIQEEKNNKIPTQNLYTPNTKEKRNIETEEQKVESVLKKHSQNFRGDFLQETVHSLPQSAEPSNAITRVKLLSGFAGVSTILFFIIILTLFQESLFSDKSNPSSSGKQKNTALSRLLKNLAFNKTTTTQNELPSVLAEQDTTDEGSIHFNISAIFAKKVSITDALEVTKEATISGSLTAPNIIYSLTAGKGIEITQGQRPTISSTLTETQIEGETGNLKLGTGLEISDSTINLNATLDDIVNNDGCDDCIEDSFVQDDLTVTSSGTIAAGAIKSGTVGATVGGTGQSSYTTGDILYASATNVLSKLPIGSDGEVLTISSGVPAWDASGASCSGNCVTTNPGATQTITPTASTATGLSIAQASSGSVDIFNVTNNAGSTKYLQVDSSGNVNIASNLDVNGTSDFGGDITFSASTPSIAITNTETLTITDGTNTLLSVADNGTSGTLTVNTLAASNIGAFTLTGNITGVGSPSLSGLGTINGGTFSGGTFNGATITGGTLSGGSISGGTYSDSGITVTAGYTITLGNGNTFNISDGTNNIFTVTDSGTVGNLSGIGTLATQGSITISGAATDLTTSTNENLTLTANGTGDIVLTTDGDSSLVLSGLDCTSFSNAGALTVDGSGVVSCSNDDGGGSVSPFTSAGGVIDKTTASERLRLLYGDLGDIQLEISNISAGTEPSADAFQINLSGGTGITTDNVDGIYVNVEGGNGTSTDLSGVHIDFDPISGSADDTFSALFIAGITASSAVENALNIGSGWDTDINFLDTSPTLVIANTGTLSVSDGTNILFSIADDTSEGDITVSGDLSVNGATSADITSGTSAASIFDSTVITLNIGSAATAVNIADGIITGTIDIGGVTANGATTVNIATNATTGDAVTIGNSAAATTVGITGGDAWSISTSGVLTLSADSAQTSALVVTDTDYINAISLGDNNITGTSYTVTAGTALTLGDNLPTIAVNSSDWDISTTGDLTGIGGITAD
ncbi:MAG: MerR family transcriptional regulator, partial [Patescibacteria group bacterium]